MSKDLTQKMIVCMKKNILDGPVGIILESMLEEMAEFYSDDLEEKIHGGQTRKCP